MKVPLIIYADTDSLLVKINTCYSNPENSSTSRINKHTASGIHYLRIVYLMPQKTIMIIAEIKTVRKTFLETNMAKILSYI